MFARVPPRLRPALLLPAIFSWQMAGAAPAAGQASAPGNQSLRQFPLPGTVGAALRATASLQYQEQNSAAEAYRYVQRELLRRGWKEAAAGASSTPEYASGTFAAGGYQLSATVLPGSPAGQVQVRLQNHGRVDFASLPLPAGAKWLFSGATSALGLTKLSMPEALEACRTRLQAAGWQPHGLEDNMAFFTKERTRLKMVVATAPAQGQQTTIEYSAELLPGELPCPLEAESVRYSSAQEELTFQTVLLPEALFAFYQEKLGALGWEWRRDTPPAASGADQLTFRSPERELIFVNVGAPRGLRREVRLRFLSREFLQALEEASAKRAR